MNECSCMECGVCILYFFLINCTVICLSNKEMHRCVNFLADFVI